MERIVGDMPISPNQIKTFLHQKPPIIFVEGNFHALDCMTLTSFDFLN